MTPRRVVITGIGAWTPIGHGRDGLWEGVVRGETAVRHVSRFDPSAFKAQNAAEIDGFDPLDHFDAHDARRLDRCAQLGVAAARQAIEDAQLDLSALERGRVGVAVGSALGGSAYGESQHTAFLENGVRSIETWLALNVYGGATAARIAIDVDARGPNLANSSSCASGAMGIGDAFGTVRRGEADVMLAGGAEAPLSPLIFAAFSHIQAMSTRNDEPELASRPFDADRDGFVMGEGAAVLVLEERSRAMRRGTPIYAEIVGFGQSNDGYHMTAPRPDGSEAARAICIALRQAGVSPAAVGYVNAHATGTVLGDRAESCALRRALGPHGASVPVSGTKGLHGHALGASGAIEVAITVLAMTNGFLPGTANFERADATCPINVLQPHGVHEHVEYALSTSFGFGGANAALVLRRADR
jgi:3-oxoacyl-[acyl-carrier-protein] synthase II